MPALLRPFEVDAIATKIIGPNGIVSNYEAGFEFKGWNFCLPPELVSQKGLMQGLIGKRSCFFIGGDIRADKEAV